ncbi:LacI family transcriptional regulator [Nonomuraea sp. MG754425]|uniref:LacI family DNA-binding transcriptional regulator n=1 Tax=Nonomuraea sp. MG754425 TaxID=2570319 RepID=UPI001F383505|nr:LacI family DNA-binding transcriptional regulator [Nonomuraea sp. MG754425]MCF6466863.1 LacI family transcriptional regulator [Nonomuraea sp. MG754425]
MDQAETPRLTIHEVARRAGVSHQTVSRYFRNNATLKPVTREKIDRVVQELNYRPNLVARSMRTRRTNRLAIAMPASVHLWPVRLLNAASAAAHAEGFQLEVVSVEGDSRARGKHVLELAGSGQVEGVLSLTPLELGAATSPIPIVVTGDYDEELHGANELADASLVAEIIEYLASLGHKVFFHVAGRQSWASARNRKLVYEQTTERLGLVSYGVALGDWSARSGYDAVRGLPEGCGVTAVVAANDHVAMGAVRGALSRGWRVPGDVSVFGWDDEELGRFATPSLSTVAVDREAQGREAVAKLVAAVRGEPATPPGPRPLNRIIIRETVGPPPA